MRKVIYCNDKLRRKFYRYAALRQPNLFIYIFSHAFLRMKYYFGLLNYVQLSQKYWDFLSKVKEDKLIEGFTLENDALKSILQTNQEVVVLLPRRIIPKNWVGQCEVQTLDELDGKAWEKQSSLKEATLINGIDTRLSRKVKDNLRWNKKKKQLESWPKSLLVLRGLLPYIMMIGVSCLLTFVALMYTPPIYHRGFRGVLLQNPVVMIINLIPIILAMLIFYFLFNRLWSALLFTGALSLAMTFSNYFKQNFRDEPLLFGDIFTVKEALVVSVDYKIKLTLPMMIVVVALLALIVVVKMVPYRTRQTKKVRAIGFGLSALLLFGGVVPTYGTTKFHKMTAGEKSTRFNYLEDYMSRGVVYSFIRSYSEFVGVKPEGYSQKRVDEILAQYPEQQLTEDKQANFLFIMLESYADLSQFEAFTAGDEDPYQYFHKIQEESYSGELIADVYAGGTITTERSFLTGYRSLGKFSKETESFIQYFSRQNYKTEAMHPFFNWFYNRKNVNKKIGFDQFYTKENKYLVDQNPESGYKYFSGYYMFDDPFLNEVMNQFETPILEGEKVADFVVTFQNHGPYSLTAQTDVAYIEKDEKYTEGTYNTVNNYLYWVNKTDKAIQSLRERVDLSPEPIVLVLFGDHLPSLTPEGGEELSWYVQEEINMDLNTEEGVLNKYTTPYVVYANESAKELYGLEFVGEGNTISPMYLIPEVFDYLDIESSSFMNYLIDLKEDLPVWHSSMIRYQNQWMRQDGEGYSEEIENLLKEYRSLEFYMQYKYNKSK